MKMAGGAVISWAKKSACLVLLWQSNQH